MNGWQLFLNTWSFQPSVIAGSIFLAGAYLYAVRFKINRKSISFLFGVLTIFFALVSPLDEIGETYLFSLHMVQHIMLGIIAPLFMVLGLPASLVRYGLRLRFIARLERLLGYYPVALILANVTFMIWHLPVLYNLTLENELVHIFEHITLLVTGTILWWPVFKPIPEGRLPPLGATVYLAAAAFSNSILGIVFTISDTVYYYGYAHPEDTFGALKMIREEWGLTQIADQKLGGAIMWEPVGAIFLIAMMNRVMDYLKGEGELHSEPSLIQATGGADHDHA